MRTSGRTVGRCAPAAHIWESLINACQLGIQFGDARFGSASGILFQVESGQITLLIMSRLLITVRRIQHFFVGQMLAKRKRDRQERREFHLARLVDDVGSSPKQAYDHANAAHSANASATGIEDFRPLQRV